MTKRKRGAWGSDGKWYSRKQIIRMIFKVFKRPVPPDIEAQLVQARLDALAGDDRRAAA